MNNQLWDPNPSMDCLVRGCINVKYRDGIRWASWCLWCGTGVSNEHEAGWGAGATTPGEDG
jgi:hypothetical protein